MQIKTRNIIGFIFLFSALIYSQNVHIIGDWFYINGQKFFIKGIGYDTHTRPGQVPWNYEFDATLMNDDLTRIKDAGFNTIRTWRALSEEELELVEASGLKVLFGIWIDPKGDFGDADFKSSVMTHVSDILSYTQNYQSVIGYLIMNEPTVDHIYEAGAQNLADLWQSIVSYIHEHHPGIPVSFSNSIAGDYIGMDNFDFAAYNAYIYNPVTISQSCGYMGYLNYLKTNRAADKPFIISEFGLSVSPGYSDSVYGYGGNTPDQQASGEILMYRQLIDAGAQGACVFQHHDGWWKGGNEFVHDDDPEEWFGLIGFSGISDKIGEVRPAWNALSNYNKAIITEPKNEHIYHGAIPIEVFPHTTVTSFSISCNDSILLSKPINGTYFKDVLNIQPKDDIKDLCLNFCFYDNNHDTLKTERIVVLASNEELLLPSISFEILPTNLVPGAKNYMNIHLQADSIFTIVDNQITYSMHPHIGFAPGIAKVISTIATPSDWSFLDDFDIPSKTKVATFAAGFTIKYGLFTKRMYASRILLSSDWAGPIVAADIPTSLDQYIFKPRYTALGLKLFPNFPNPFNSYTFFQFYIPGSGDVRIDVFTMLGQHILKQRKKYLSGGVKQTKVNLSKIQSGVYFYRIRYQNLVATGRMILIRNP